MGIGMPELIVVVLMLAVVLWPAVRICERLGHPRWLGILSIFPLANVALLWYLALATPAGQRRS